MVKNILFLTVGTLTLSTILWANPTIDCRILTKSMHSCNPYGSKMIRAKEVKYDLDTKKLIVSKTLPLPKKETMKVVSVAEMLEAYKHVDESLRFRGSDTEETKYSDTEISIDEEEVEESIPKIVQPKIDIIPIDINETVSKIVQTKSDNNLSSLQKNAVYHIVSGDIFSKIAHKFGFSTQALLDLNHLNKKSILKIGQAIQIPLPQKMVDSIAQASYKIEKGDTLLSIAHKFNIDPKVLVAFNHLKSSAIIHEGKSLALPLPHVLKRLEVEKSIALSKKKEKEKTKQLLLAKKKKEEALKNKKASRVKARISKRRLYLSRRGVGKHKLRVTATAYTSHSRQTDSTPFLAAWNNRLRPGMKIIAVSRDLISRYGLRNGSRVKISGLRGYYTVRDKMNKRFRKRIDIYMGLNRRRALRWGRRSVKIYW